MKLNTLDTCNDYKKIISLEQCHERHPFRKYWLAGRNNDKLYHEARRDAVKLTSGSQKSAKLTQCTKINNLSFILKSSCRHA